MSNVTISQHPCVKAKLSQLRSTSRSARETRSLVQDISTLLASEVLGAHLTTQPSGEDVTPLGAKYSVDKMTTRCVLVPVLRSGLGMVEAFNDMLPEPVPVYHLGLFREKVSLSPVEYYNKLPTGTQPYDIAFILDPIVATGGTAEAAIQILREWGVKKIIFVAVLGTTKGVARAQEEWKEGVHFHVGGMDETTNDSGYIVPGLGDIGDRLFITQKQ